MKPLSQQHLRSVSQICFRLLRKNILNLYNNKVSFTATARAIK